jgi:RNA polymerase sigma factor (sigma-70 family)
MKLYVAWPRLRRDGNVDAFTRRIVVNAHLDETRRPWRRERPGLEGLDLFADADAADDRDVLVAALADLPEGQRRVVVLRHYWGLSVEEAAADLGIAAGTVKSQTAHALRKLEQTLSPDFEGRSRHG